MNDRQDAKGGVVVDINGPALRHIRVLTGIGSAELSTSLGVSRAYISKIECGYSARVSGAFYARLCAELNIKDRRVLMANPNASDEAVA
ncbi:helix-turn-helix domain-containing protein [Kibdelosporangium aridum]|nr:helix-turn-helix domain-containing protein [Kibdelosporangium aridum]